MKEKEQKLLARPVEDDTTILAKMIVDFGDFKGLFEKWTWDGVSASSLVFLSEDVVSMDSKALIQYVFGKMQLPVDPQTTYSSRDGFTFVNFGFETKD